MTCWDYLAAHPWWALVTIVVTGYMLAVAIDAIPRRRD